ncbi:hypothetical protein DOTSEDRAFT_72019 [Dothistroma septosporum NZE10]|uniref:Uncharacterized protein n=1 Tax=Dothistroma septosporum (strain NZE10 / CBS 128990) TaxID=675120 RepID=N1PPS4_DOTSN|nr:hypothetical protein DOTSEDRAFT_72019 [Dothistroma septosporum NZE10]
MRNWLNNHGIQYKAWAPEARRKTLVKRHYRGLYCYDNCATEELVTFHKQRGMQEPPDRIQRTALIATLVQRDDNAKFEKLLGLRAELRVNIYELRFAWIAQVRDSLWLSYPPPITQVNQLLQQESLPLFFQTFRFELQAYWDEEAAAYRDNSFQQDLDKITDEDVGFIRSLYFIMTARSIEADPSYSSDIDFML